jgi:excisionase family DNA binding protein
VTSALMTASTVSELLRLDTSTVYRMAQDGRLPAVKIGRQWRFPADAVGELLQLDGPDRPPRSADVAAPGTRSLSPDLAGPLVEVAGASLGVMMVVCDLDGRPLTEVANPCERFAARRDDPALLEECVADWRQLADDPDLAPHFRTGRLGFQCARALVRLGDRLVAMVLAGGLPAPGQDPTGLYDLDAAARRRVLDALPNITSILARLIAAPGTAYDPHHQQPTRGTS